MCEEQGIVVKFFVNYQKIFKKKNRYNLFSTYIKYIYISSDDTFAHTSRKETGIYMQYIYIYSYIHIHISKKTVGVLYEKRI